MTLLNAYVRNSPIHLGSIKKLAVKTCVRMMQNEPRQGQSPPISGILQCSKFRLQSETLWAAISCPTAIQHRTVANCKPASPAQHLVLP